MILSALHSDVHVLHASLDAEFQNLPEWHAFLSQDERQRATRFHFDLHRARFIVARGILRRLLGHYLKIPPEQIAFRYGRNNKPAVLGDLVHFNISHSEDRALFAFSATTALGVDIEAIRPLPDILQLASTAFSIAEQRALNALAPELQREAFFRCWTRKEAFIKALGHGMSYALDEFSVSLDEPARVVHVEAEPNAPAQWTLQHLTPHADFVGAIATRQQHSRILFDNWKKVLS